MEGGSICINGVGVCVYFSVDKLSSYGWCGYANVSLSLVCMSRSQICVFLMYVIISLLTSMVLSLSMISTVKPCCELVLFDSQYISYVLRMSCRDKYTGVICDFEEELIVLNSFIYIFVTFLKFLLLFSVIYFCSFKEYRCDVFVLCHHARMRCKSVQTMFVKSDVSLFYQFVFFE